MDNTQNIKVKKNSDAKIRANNKYSKTHYKRIGIDIKPDEADYIRQLAKDKDLSITQLILQAVRVFDDVSRQNDKCK